MRAVLFCLLATLLLAGCDDGVIGHSSHSAEVPDDPLQSTAPSYAADPDPWSSKQVFATGFGVAEDEIDLSIWANWIDLVRGDAMNSADVVLRIDPGAQAQVLRTGSGDWCAGPTFEVTPTGNPGEWRIRRLSGSECSACGPLSVWDYHGGFILAEVRLKIGIPGSWAVELEPAAPLCDCDGCFQDVAFGGGTLTDPPPA